MNQELLQKSINSRNEKAIRELVDIESAIEWARTSPTPGMPIKDKNDYLMKIGRDYLKRKNKIKFLF